MIWFLLTSGLFLGWSLGANDAANIFGTAVSTRMLKFRVAAGIACVFMIIGAMVDGAGATHTLGVLGDVNALAGSFTVALAAALSVTILIKRGLPVSVSQAIVGAIIGWNIFTASPTDVKSLINIVISWIINPVLACGFSFLIFNLVKYVVAKSKIHMLELDIYTRLGLIIVAAFGSYSLGANNVSKVVGVFVTSSPFKDMVFFNFINISGINQLYLIGALSMALGVITYSHKTISTIGSQIFKLTPLSAFASILGASIVLFIFSSEGLSKIITSTGLPAIPLVPISITQSMVGAVAGIGFAKGGRYINYKIIGKIAIGWAITPISALIICLVTLFFVQNVFQQKVVNPISFEVSIPVLVELENTGVSTKDLSKLEGQTFTNQSEFRQNLNSIGINKESILFRIFQTAKIENYRIDSNYAKQKLNPIYFTRDQIESVKRLHNESFKHKWQIVDRLKLLSEEWRFIADIPENSAYNKDLGKKYEILFSTFKVQEFK
ncbi:MAG: inorganic phosphate transporter [Ignavibacteria bacterium]